MWRSTILLPGKIVDHTSFLRFRYRLVQNLLMDFTGDGTKIGPTLPLELMPAKEVTRFG